MRIEFSVEVTPYPQPRPRVVNRHAYEPKRITDYKNAIRTIAAIQMKGREPLTGLVRVEMTFRKNKRLGSRMYGDIDNLEKAVYDALTGICYADDALVVRSAAEKIDTKDEGVDIVITDEL